MSTAQTDISGRGSAVGRGRSRWASAASWLRKRLRDPRATPFLLILPALVMLGAIYGYPLLRLVWLSLHKFTLPQLIGTKPVEFLGLQHFTEMFTDPFFWVVVLRTVVFMIVCVVVTMGIGLGIAVVMRHASRSVRLILTGTMILAWASPWLVVTAVFQWMVDYKFGVVNYILDQLPFIEFSSHNWFVHPWQGFSVIAAVVVWQAVPFPAIALHAGLMQVPQDLEEAARVDGAGPWKVFRNVTLPVLRPILLILTIYSIIWDFQIFNQAYLMLDARPTRDYYLFSIYSFTEAFGASHYGMGAAIAVVMVLMLIGATFTYIRRMMRIGEVD